MGQDASVRTRRISQLRSNVNNPIAIDDENAISLAAPEELKPSRILAGPASPKLRVQPLISTAINERLGARYSWGATGPSAVDCSGFVWSAFHAAGIDFERASARTLWERFSAPAPEEQFKFGTLVFFNGLEHIGIVADENGFYHASRHHGVVYSPFNDYWRARIDGFRRVPLPVTVTTD